MGPESHPPGKLSGVLRVAKAETLDGLALDLAGVLGEPLGDPMAAEWIVVASAGTQRWLRLELSRHLGASGGGRTDGVAANLDMLFPRRFEAAVLAPGVDSDTDPWKLERVAWAVMEVLEGATDAKLGPLRTAVPGATRWGRARRVADLFDRYIYHRPEMIRRWTGGDDVDSTGRPLAGRDAWQAYLWRLVRARIATPSPAETRPERLRALRDGDCPAEVPGRVCLFGLSTLPGGAGFLELAEALGATRDVHLLFRDVSPAASRKVVSAVSAGRVSVPGLPGPVLGGGSLDVATHPLVVSWAEPSLATAAILAGHLASPAGPAAVSPSNLPASADRERHSQRTDGPPGRALSLLAKIQADIHADVAPAGDHELAAGDTSVRIHSCHGPTRQVEVLRDQILHLLASDPTLKEDDIVVVCPALDMYAPLVEAVLGPSAGSLADRADRHGPPALSYRIADRSLLRSVPLLGAVGALVDLLDGRFDVDAVIEFAGLPPVRERFGLSEADLAAISTWAYKANTRWGVDGAHRARWGIPAGYDGGSWSAAIDRLLIGVAVSDTPEALALGGVSPIAVEGDGVDRAGRLADLLWRLANLEEQARTPRCAGEWVSFLRDAASDLLVVSPESAWQARRLERALETVASDAVTSGEPAWLEVTLADMRQVLSRHLQGSAGSADFFRGGITFSSLTPLRGVPFRVTCLLGMDEASLAAGAPDGDVLTAGDEPAAYSDARSDTRQAILETVLGAREHLVITRNGRSVVTNQPVPESVMLSELADVIRDTLRPEGRDEALSRIEVHHPRQSFDAVNFLSEGPEAPDLAQSPWSFDSVALAGARSRTRPRHARGITSVRLAGGPEPSIELDELRSFLDHPVRHFLRRTLGVSLPAGGSRREMTKPTRPAELGAPQSPFAGRDLLVALDGIESWQLAALLLEHRLLGGSVDIFAARMQASYALPPGRLGDKQVADAAAKVDPLIRQLEFDGLLASPASLVELPGSETQGRGIRWEHRQVDVELGDGTRITGEVRVATATGGPLKVSVSRAQDKDKLAPWLEAIALSADEPARQWRATLLNRPASTRPGPSKQVECVRRTLEVPADDPAERKAKALDALEVVVDLYRRGSREALPLFPKLTPKLASAGPDETNFDDAWRPFAAKGDGEDEWIRFAFDTPELADLLCLAILAHDPPGPGDDRARRYARLLWGAVERSTATSNGPSAGRPVGRAASPSSGGPAGRSTPRGR